MRSDLAKWIKGDPITEDQVQFLSNILPAKALKIEFRIFAYYIISIIGRTGYH